MTIHVDYYGAQHLPPAETTWFTHLWVAHEGRDAIGFLTTSWEGKIMLVMVDPDHRGQGAAEALVDAAAARFPDGLTHGYPISKAGERFVATHHITVHPVEERKGYELWPEADAEREGLAALEIIRGRGPKPFPTTPTAAAPATDAPTT